MRSTHLTEKERKGDLHCQNHLWASLLLSLMTSHPPAGRCATGSCFRLCRTSPCFRCSEQLSEETAKLHSRFLTFADECRSLRVKARGCRTIAWAKQGESSRSRSTW